jgi:hypothetical protein
MLVIKNRIKVKESFLALQVASRRREKFDTGELLMLVDSPDSPVQLRFVRVNGLRPSRGVECQYTLESEELRLKTESDK